MKDTEYLRFERKEIKGRKTPIVKVWNRRYGILLGEIEWYGPWRQFCFFSNHTAIFNNTCLEDIQGVIKELMAERYLRKVREVD